MRFDLAKELEFLYYLMLRLGTIAYNRFHDRPLVVHTKPDGTQVTDLDMLIHEAIVQECERYRPEWVVRSEEGKEVPLSSKVFIVDPIDGTRDSIRGQNRTPRVSLAMISIGVCVEGTLVGGVVGAPLLPGPLAIFKGGHRIGAWREHEACRIDTEAQRGTVLVANKDDATNRQIRERLLQQGLTPFRIDGTVFRACSFMDPSLLQEWSGNLPKQPVVGMINNGRLHDFAAVVPMAESIGAVVTTRNGDCIDWHNNNGCVMANNMATHHKLLTAING